MFCDINCFQKHQFITMIYTVPSINVRTCLLHWDGSCKSYQWFFSHLRAKLDSNINTELGFCELVIGSDEEKAILKAIQQSFPTATQLLCQSHLQENVRRHLQQKVGVPEKTGNEIISLIFGKEALTNSKEPGRF